MAVELITGILTAITCFGFIGLQFSRMQLSRNGLSVLVASLESVINKQKVALQEEQQNAVYRTQQADELVRMLEVINIVRPLPKEYAWALASCSNTSTFRQQVEHSTSSHTGSISTLSLTDSPKHPMRLASTFVSGAYPSASSLLLQPAASSPLLQPTSRSPLTVNSTLVTAGKTNSIIALAQKNSDGSSVDEDAATDPATEASMPQPPPAQPRSVSQSPAHSKSTTITPKAAVRTQLASSTLSPLSSSVSVQAATAALSVNSKVGWMDGSPVARPRRSDSFEEEEEQSVDGVVTATRASQRSSMSMQSSLATSQSTPKSPAAKATTPSQSQQTAYREKQQPPSSSKPAVAAAEDSRVCAEVSKTSTSVNSLSVSAHVTQVDHHSRWKQYEADLTALLHQQAQHAATAALEHPHATPASRGSMAALAGKGRLSQSSSDDTDFTSGVAASRKPTLVELLAHPVCVELVKDELERIHSVENLVFYLHAVRYRHLQAAKTRRMLAQLIFDTFVADGSPEQINISTRQRDAIQAQLRRRGDDAATPQLFREAEREVLGLMETNVMKAFAGTSAYRLCALVLSSLDVDKASGMHGEERRDDGSGGGNGVGGVGGVGGGRGEGRASMVTDMFGGSQLSKQRQSVEASQTASAIEQ